MTEPHPPQAVALAHGLTAVYVPREPGAARPAPKPTPSQRRATAAARSHAARTKAAKS
jgi:hypothetical protein